MLSSSLSLDKKETDLSMPHYINFSHFSQSFSLCLALSFSFKHVHTHTATGCGSSEASMLFSGFPPYLLSLSVRSSRALKPHLSAQTSILSFVSWFYLSIHAPAKFKFSDVIWPTYLFSSNTTLWPIRADKCDCKLYKIWTSGFCRISWLLDWKHILLSSFNRTACNAKTLWCSNTGWQLRQWRFIFHWSRWEKEVLGAGLPSSVSEVSKVQQTTDSWTTCWGIWRQWLRKYIRNICRKWGERAWVNEYNK